ncbi:hypothetical protein JNW93_03290 [Lacticaseibacillus rhamnosus]|uniref:hypothetical protein n=1 Tax=Lacticaseibacillus rhamnosus TaxID=47715 RepID=UPI001951FEEF|nr:hypothetical protein [Lacticaseibacillus rhamnosus]MBM6439724.1 hypothetical protein [Lacticaseibacillus rhamnosus]
MSEEIVFFNPGDAVANDFDFAAARRSAQIYKAQHVVDEGLVVAKDKDGKYSVFYEAAGTPDSQAKSEYKDVGKYTILAHL